MNKYNTNDDTFTQYLASEDITSKSICSIEQDQSNILWISTRNGLVRFNPNNEALRTYHKKDGLLDNEFAWFAGFKNKRGKLYFGSNGGFISFMPKDIQDNDSPVQIALTSFNVFGKELALSHALQQTDEIVLEYNQNFFTIQYAALNFSDKNKQKFSYFLKGFDKQWSTISNSTFANYTDVPPGRYSFEIKAANSDGIWMNYEHLLTIVIQPAFWMTWWFKLLISSMVIGLVWGAYRYRLKSLIQLQRVRLKIAKDLHDEVGGNLSSISIASTLIGKKNNLDDKQKEYLRDIYTVSRTTTEVMRDIVWFINPEHDLPQAMIGKIKEITRLLLAEKKYSIEIDENIFEAIKNLERRKEIYFIYKEILTNIVRHAEATEVFVTMTLAKNRVVMTIKDNGKGFDSSIEFSGSGLKNIRNRVKEINGKIEIYSAPNTGAEILITIKIP